MPYEQKPLLTEIASTPVGEMVTLEDVTVTNEIWRGGNNNTIVLFGVERNGQEGVVKTFDGSCPTKGQSVTVVGKKSEYKGKFSVEVNPKFGGGVALDGDPMHSFPQEASPAQAAPAQKATRPLSVVKRKLTVKEYREDKDAALDHYVVKHQELATAICTKANIPMSDIIVAACIQGGSAHASGESISLTREEIVGVDEFDPDIPF